MTQLSLVDLTKEYPNSRPALDGLTLDVSGGELLVMLGPSGSGKTTTLRLITGLVQPTRGDVRFDGQSVLSVAPERRGAVMVFQQHALFPFMSVGDNVAFGLRVRKLDRTTIRARVAEALATVQLSGFEERWPDELSGGQRQRIALARVLAVRPRLMLLDEPLSNLDRELREELRDVIARLQRETDITTLMVTHDQAEAVAMGDRIALLFDGRLRQIGPARDFYERPADMQVARFFGGGNFLPGVKEGRFVQTDVGRLQIGASDLPDGRVTVSIRPEAIELGANGCNTLTAIVTNYSYHGQVAHCRAGISGTELKVIVPPFQPYRPDDRLVFHVPQDRICLLPYEGGSE